MNHSERVKRRRQLATDVENGMGIGTVAGNHGVGVGTVRQACLEFGVPIRLDESREVSRSTYDIIAKLFNVDLTYDVIADQHNVTRSTVFHIRTRCIEAGIPLPARKKGKNHVQGIDP